MSKYENNNSNIMPSPTKNILLSTVSILLGAFFFTTLLSAVFSLQEGLQKNASESLGGDVTLSLNQSFSDEEKEALSAIAENNNADISFTDSFTAMVISNEAETLTSMSVVDVAYPLYGKVEMMNGEFVFPQENEIILDSSFAEETGLKIGEMVQLGNGNFTIIGFFERLPDASSFSFFGSKGLISQAGLLKTEVLLSQNRSSTTALFANKETQISLAQDLETSFPEKKYNISTVENGDGTTSRIFSEVQKISISLIAAITLLFSTSFFMGVYFYIQKESRTIAVLKSLGMHRWDIVKKYILGMGIFWSVIGIIGLALGAGLLVFVAPFLSESIGSDITLSTRALYCSIGFVLLLPAAALGVMIRQFFSLSPALLLKGNDSAPRSTPLLEAWKTSAFWKGMFFYSAILFPFGVLLAIISSSLLFPFFFFGGLIIIFTVLSSILWGVFFLMRKWKHALPSFFTRTVTAFVTEPGQKKFFILSGFFALFFIICSVAIVQKSFVENLQTLSGEDAPSAFFLDITGDQSRDFEDVFPDEERIEVFPILRAKITELAGKSITDDDSREISRAFNINFSDTLGDTEKLISGKEWEAGTDKNMVSVESDFAEENNVQVGDEIIFDVLGRDTVFTVSGIRKLEQKDFNPWFMFTFPKNALSSAPKTYIGFWWASDENIVSSVKSEVIRAFPNISAIETQEIRESLQEVTTVLERGITAISILLLISSALTVLSFVSEIGRGRRSSEKVMQKIGMEKGFIQRLLLAEISLVLIIPFVLSLLLSSAIVWILGIYFFAFTEVVFSALPFALFAGVYLVSLVVWWKGIRSV